MAKSVRAIVEPTILVWMRTAAGLSIEETAEKIPTKPANVTSWELGEKSPSMSQLRKLATIFKRPLSDFYLPDPIENPIPHDFRRLPGQVALNYGRELRYQLRSASERRQLALDLATELDQAVPTLDINLKIHRDYESIGTEVRALLRLPSSTQSTWRNSRTAYNSWRAAIENLGVLVFQVTNIPTSEMLGFSLASRPFPVIAVNRKLRPNGRTFTLLHEFIHVLLGQSSICDIDESDQRPPEEQRVEVFCNAVAGAVLVPKKELLAHPIVRQASNLKHQWSIQEVEEISKNFSVSNEVVFRRLLSIGLATQDQYVGFRQIWGRISDDVAIHDPDADIKRNVPQEVLSNYGKPFTSLVYSSYENSYTSLSDVSRYLGLRPEKVNKLYELLVRGQ